MWVPSALPTLIVCTPLPRYFHRRLHRYFWEAKKHISETRCVSGKVLRVKEGNRGVTFLDFCEDYLVCPFTVVVFPSDLKHVGTYVNCKARWLRSMGRSRSMTVGRR